MDDRIAAAISNGLINKRNISFRTIRQFAGVDCGLRSSLDYGRAIIETPDQLDQYLYTYGRMTEDKWSHLLRDLSFTPEPIQLNDYGCGQGLASALMFDHFGEDFIGSIKRIVLIEPSLPALMRAKSVISCYNNNVEVISINKRLDDVCADELAALEGANVHHIFSEVLDIASFDHFALFEKMFSSRGQHTVFAVSHDRNFYGGSGRFIELERAIVDPSLEDQLSLVRSDIEKFECRGNRQAISWFLEAEVLSGSL